MLNKARQFLSNRIIWLWLIIIGALILRLFLLGHKPFWIDEGVTWFIGTGEIRSDFDPALYYKILGLAIQVFGGSEYASRLPSALFGWLSVIMLYVTGKELFGIRYGLLTAGASAVSAYLVSMSQEARLYSLIGLEIIIILYFYFRILREEKNKQLNWAGLFLASIIALYTFTLFIFFLFYLSVLLLILRRRELQRLLIRVEIFAVCLIIFYLPQLLDAAAKTSKRRHLIDLDILHLKVNVARVIRAGYVFLCGEDITRPAVNAVHFGSAQAGGYILAAAVGIILAGVVFLIVRTFIKSYRSRDFEGKFVQSNFYLAALFSLTFFLIAVSSARHMIFIFIPLIYLLAYSVLKIGKRLYFIVGIYLLLSFISLFVYYRQPKFIYEDIDWREVGLFLCKNLQAGDGIFFAGGRNAFFAVKYYSGEMEQDVYYRFRPDDPDQQAGRPQIIWDRTSITVQDCAAELLSKYRRLWVLESDFRWNEDTGVLRDYEAKIWNFGTMLQVRLYMKKMMNDE